MKLIISNRENIECPKYYECPLCLQIMNNPYINKYGHTFDYECIIESLQHKKECPITKQSLTKKDLFPNYATQNSIETFLKEIGSKYEVEKINTSLRNKNIIPIQEFRNLSDDPMRYATAPPPQNNLGPDLIIATKNGNYETTVALIEAGADVNAKDNYGKTPLLWAAISGSLELAQVLISAGADVHARDFHNMTPLHWASYNGHLNVVQVLISSGADPNAKNNYNRTPLDRASRNGHHEVVRYLKPYKKSGCVIS